MFNVIQQSDNKALSTSLLLSGLPWLFWDKVSLVFFINKKDG